MLRFAGERPGYKLGLLCFTGLGFQAYLDLPKPFWCRGPLNSAFASMVKTYNKVQYKAVGYGSCR